MRRKMLQLVSLSLIAGLFVFACAQAAAGPGRTRAAGAQQEFSFSLTRLPENPSKYSLVISNDEEQSISGIFSLDQLQILRAMMSDAEKFALGSEAIGTKDALTTRFEDKHEVAFIVDVEKLGNQSRLFLTLNTEMGRMTVVAGKVVRGTRREEGFFFDLLSRLESILPKLPAQAPK